jgi:2'-5' RNA ligase
VPPTTRRIAPWRATPPPVRLFWAIELPEAIAARLAEVQAAVRAGAPTVRASWSRPQGMHLTLKFLGELAGEDAGERAAEAVAPGVPREGPLRLAVEGLGCFGGRVVWAGVGGPDAEALARLAEHVDRGSRRVGVERERRPFRGHVTLARVRVQRGRRPSASERAAASALRDLLGATPLGPLPFEARELVLFQSELHGGKPAVYTARARLALTPPGAPDSR